jgi:hypothetical protein
MKKQQQKDLVGQFALIVTIVGLGGYIILNSGLFRKAPEPQVVDRAPSAAQTQAELTLKWKEELRAIDIQSGEKQKELEDLTSRLARIRLEIQDRENALSRLGRSDIKRSRSADPIATVFRSVSHLKSYLIQEAGADRFIFEADDEVQVPAGAQMVSMIRPFAEESVFLRRSGLRWASAVSKAALDLKAPALIIRYIEGDFEQKRADVLKRFIQEQVSHIADKDSTFESIPRVEMEAVQPEQIMSASDVDLFIQTLSRSGGESTRTARRGDQ